MLFWTRAILCIGTVTTLAIQRLPPQSGSLKSVPIHAGPAAAALVGEACRARPDLCAAVVTRGLGALADPLTIPVPHAASPSPAKTLRHGSGHDLPVALGVRSLT